MKKIGLVFVWAMVMISCDSMLGFDDYTISGEGKSQEGVRYVITDYALQNYVPVPAAGAMAVKSLVRPDMVVSAEWQDEGGTALETGEGFAFAQSAVYRARITLAAQSPYGFSEDFPFVYPAGTVAEQDTSDMDVDERTVTVIYKRAAAIGDAPGAGTGEPEDQEPKIIAPIKFEW
jgi:hypothetical protein